MKDTKVKEDGKVDYIWYKNQYDRLLREKCKYEHRIEKAIEYIESYNVDFENCKFGEAPISINELQDLLNILRGEDNE